VPIIIRIALFYVDQLSDLPKRWSNWISVRVFQKHKRYKVHNEVLSTNTDKIAIFAIYPGTTPLKSVLRIVESLQKQQYLVLAVINDNLSADRFISALEEKQSLILLRQNLGADFGAYQTGIRYLKKIELYNQIKYLVLINDSFFVTPLTQDSISKICDSDSQFNCIYLHHQGITHASSMFLKLDQQILQTKEFNQFWGQYYPYSNKRKIILHGEHKLSSAVGLEKFQPIVNLESINVDMNYHLTQSEIVQLLTWSRLSSNLLYFYISKSIDNLNWREIYSYTLSNLQISNALGFNMTRVVRIPLKMDLVKLGLVSAFNYLSHAEASGCDQEEILELQQILSTKGGFLTDSLIKRFLKVYAIPRSISNSRLSEE
jgi:Rhamnan synthesis protein F